MSHEGREPRALSPLVIGIYAGPALPVAMALYAVSVVIPAYYAQATALTPAAIGIVLLLTRVADVGFDIFVGYLSDRTLKRFGGRKPWLVLGGVVMGASFLALTSPPRDAGAAYLFVTLLAFYAGWSLLVVPHTSWGSEVAGGYRERSQVFGWRAGAGYVGSIAFAVLPTLPIFPTHEFSGQALRFSGLLVAGLLAVTLPLALRMVSSRRQHVVAPPDLRHLMSAIAANQPLRLYTAAAIVNGFSSGMFIGIAYIYQTEYMQLSSWVWLILLCYTGTSLLSLPLWSRIVARIGKTRAWALGLGVSAVSYLPMGFLPPGLGSLPWMVAIFAVSGAAYSISNVAAPSVLGDVAEYEAFRSKAQMTGSIFALQALIDKLNIALGGGAAFLLVGLFGYVGGHAVTPRAVFGLQLAYLYIPALLNALGLVLIWRFPLHAGTQKTIARWMQRRAAHA
jgi:GPH family glycoside/pentoside/hexuronide:cation symporter